MPCEPLGRLLASLISMHTQMPGEWSTLLRKLHIRFSWGSPVNTVLFEFCGPAVEFDRERLCEKSLSHLEKSRLATRLRGGGCSNLRSCGIVPWCNPCNRAEHREWFCDCVMTINGGGHMPGISTIHEFLREAHVPYTVVPHRRAYTAQEEAAATRGPGYEWAKVGVCVI